MPLVDAFCGKYSVSGDLAINIRKQKYLEASLLLVAGSPQLIYPKSRAPGPKTRRWRELAAALEPD